MVEYIEREAVLSKIKNLQNTEPATVGKKQFADGYFVGLDEAEIITKQASAADVAEVKHGEWIYHEMVASHDGLLSGYSCSECSGFVDEEVFDSDEFHKSFCGCCGAKMDKKEGVENDR